MKFKLFTCLIFAISVFSMTGCTARETPPANPKGAILYQDNFDNPESGWKVVTAEQGILGYENGSYRMMLKIPRFTSFVTANKIFNDAQIEVDATKVNGPDQSVYGIICRASNEQNFYVFAISSAGYYGIGKFVDGKGPTMLGTDGPEMLKASDAIKKGNETNHIAASCNGNMLTLYINGQKVSSVQDQDLDGGDVGLLLRTFDQGNIDINFDNFVVKIPE